MNASAAALLRGTCAQRLPQMDAWLHDGSPGQGLFYANPPRSGLEPEVLAWIADSGRFARGAYLSCHPGTLARDLVLLERGGFVVQRLVPYDFFPGTFHVETLALLIRKEQR